MNKSKFIKRVGLIAATAMLPLSQAALADGNWGISGWINQGLTYVDDGNGSDIISAADNGNTLGSRITLAGSTDLPNSGLSAGFDVTIEVLNKGTGGGGGLGIGTDTSGPISSFDGTNGDILNALGHSVYVAGSFGKVTLGLQSMPTDNIAVLEDPSLTLWSSISPVFRGNGVTINNSGAAVTTRSTYGDLMNCYTASGLRGNLGIGLDCNGIYRQGIRYDLPAFGPVTVAVGYANDDVYDVAAKYKGSFSGINVQLAVGYATNQSSFVDPGTASSLTNAGAITAGVASQGTLWTDADNFQMQLGLMDPGTGIFGTFAYQNESISAVSFTATGAGVGTTALQDSDSYWTKVGIKKAFNSLGDTSFAFQYGSYNDQFGLAEANVGVNGSELERIGFEVNQYFGSRLILYGVYENLDGDVDCSATATAACTNLAGGGDLDMFTAGLTFFF